MAPIFTIDYEDWDDALHGDTNNQHSSFPIFYEYLLPLLRFHKIKPIIYSLEYCRPIENDSYELSTHGRYHRWWENADRRPYQWLGFTGGFWFRVLPLWFIRQQVIKNGMFYIHPHDIDEHHPKLKNPFLNWKRHVGLKGAKRKLEKLIASGIFRD